MRDKMSALKGTCAIKCRTASISISEVWGTIMVGQVATLWWQYKYRVVRALSIRALGRLRTFRLTSSLAISKARCWRGSRWWTVLRTLRLSSIKGPNRWKCCKNLSKTSLGMGAVMRISNHRPERQFHRWSQAKLLVMRLSLDRFYLLLALIKR